MPEQLATAFTDKTSDWCKAQCGRYQKAASEMMLFADQSDKDIEYGRCEIRPGLLRCLTISPETDVCGLEGEQMTIHYFTAEELAQRTDATVHPENNYTEEA